MKIGTKSLLFGVHQFIWHPLTVYWAWKQLYGRPTWKEVICIILHDWGYWGKSDMDGPEGTLHPVGGAWIAGKLLGHEYEMLCLLHSRSYANEIAQTPSKLCWADKMSIKFEPAWWYLLRARLSGELNEYRQVASKAGVVPLTASDKEWFDRVADRLVSIGLMMCR